MSATEKTTRIAYENKRTQYGNVVLFVAVPLAPRRLLGSQVSAGLRTHSEVPPASAPLSRLRLRRRSSTQ